MQTSFLRVTINSKQAIEIKQNIKVQSKKRLILCKKTAAPKFASYLWRLKIRVKDMHVLEDGRVSYCLIEVKKINYQQNMHKVESHTLSN